MERLTKQDYSNILSALNCHIEQKQEQVERENNNGSVILAEIDSRYIKELEETRAKVMQRLSK